MVAGWYRRKVTREACMGALRLVRLACLAGALVSLADLLVFGVAFQGVRSAVPPLVRAEALAELERHLDESQLRLVEASYSEPNASGVRRFVGRPSQLATFSPLSRAFCASVGREGSPKITEGMRRVQEEYAALGLSISSVQAAYVARCVHDLLSYLLACLIDSTALCLVGRRGSPRKESSPSGVVEHMLNVG